MDNQKLDQIAEAIDRGLQPIRDMINSLEKTDDPPKKEEKKKDEFAERMGIGVNQYIEYKESGRLEGKDLSGKKPEGKPKSNLEGKTI